MEILIREKCKHCKGTGVDPDWGNEHEAPLAHPQQGNSNFVVICPKCLGQASTQKWVEIDKLFYEGTIRQEGGVINFQDEASGD